jgi:TonB family protein
MKPRVSGFIVSSGPAGGGGLRLFNVLHGEKIYTIYLPMPGKSWILQYCAHEDSPKPPETARTVQVHTLPPLTPPDAVGQFDFHRPPSKSEPGNNMIVLHGLIHEDGSVSNLEILKGYDQLLDDAAMAAFARWKFRPALRAGTPVAVDILVGIPAVVPGG